MLLKGVDQIWTGDQGVAVPCLTTWLRRHIKIICSLLKKMTPTGFEPVLPPWKGGVLTTWPWSLILMTASRSMQYLKYYETPRAGLEPATARLTAVCSTNWAIEDYYKVYHYYIIYLQNNIQELSTSFTLSLLWLKPRPISNSQLHALPHFHLCPIYLVVFKGSYYLSVWEILSLGGLHA